MLALVAMLHADTGGRWGAPETLLATATSAAWVVDAAQSMALQRQGFFETNPVLGHHPSNGTVAVYFAGMVGATWVLPHLVSNPTVRRVLLGLTLASELAFIGHNVRIGVRL